MKTTDLESFGAVLLWLAPFFAGQRLRWGTSTHRRRWLSVAAGIAIAYVFVDLLPQMNRMQEAFTAAAEGKGLPLPEFRVYAAALVGFISFYSLQNLVAASSTQPEGVSPLFRRLDIGGFAGYCGLMSYLLVADAKVSLVSLTLYSVAMFFHFWLVDHSLRREYAELYDRAGRWAIVAGILVGLVGISGLASDALVPTLLGFIGGGVVINSLRAELPDKGEGRALPFVIGALGYAILLLTIELAEKHGYAGASAH
jgi:zinc transporter ZupT